MLILCGETRVRVGGNEIYGLVKACRLAPKTISDRVGAGLAEASLRRALAPPATLGHCCGMRSIFILLLAFWPGFALADQAFYPAKSGKAEAPVLTVYSSLDEPLAQPMIRGFQEANPDVAVRYEDMLTGEIYDRIVGETDAGKKTADFAFSSAMDLQVKLSNDGYAQVSNLPMSAAWPKWANWRNTAYALTFEPAVFVYHKPSFAHEPVPSFAGGIPSTI